MIVKDYEVKASRVIDGDTFASNLVEFEVMGVRVSFPEVHFRLLGVDTPEKKDKGYKEATNYTKKLIEGKTVRIEAAGKDVFDRVLCTVYVEGQEKSLNQLLLDNKFAVVYKK